MIKHLSITSPRYINEARSRIDCDVVFSHLGLSPVPFTAAANDDLEHGRKIFEELVAGKWGEIAPYIPGNV